MEGPFTRREVNGCLSPSTRRNNQIIIMTSKNRNGQKNYTQTSCYGYIAYLDIWKINFPECHRVAFMYSILRRSCVFVISSRRMWCVWCCDLPHNRVTFFNASLNVVSLKKEKGKRFFLFFLNIFNRRAQQSNFIKALFIRFSCIFYLSFPVASYHRVVIGIGEQIKCCWAYKSKWYLICM